MTTMTPRLCRILGAAAFAAALALGGAALAQPTPADRSIEALQRGTALFERGRITEAIAELERADQLAAGRSAAIEAALARAYAGAGQPERAVSEARGALAIEATGPAAREARIVVCQNQPAPEGDAFAATDPSGGAARKVGDGVARPEILYRVNPQYPADLRHARAQGTVIVDAVIDEEGCVTGVRVLKSAEPGFGQATVDAVGRWVFQPATFEGRPVKVYYTLTTSFAVEQEPHRGAGRR